MTISTTLRPTIEKSASGSDRYIFRNFKIVQASLHQVSADNYSGKYGFRLLIPKSIPSLKAKIDAIFEKQAAIKIPGQKYKDYITDGDNRVDTHGEKIPENPMFLEHWLYKAKNMSRPILRDPSGTVIKNDFKNIFHSFGMYVDIWFQMNFYGVKTCGTHIAGLFPTEIQKICNDENSQTRISIVAPASEIKNYASNDDENIDFDDCDF